jgi:hypothetical protein
VNKIVVLFLLVLSGATAKGQTSSETDHCAEGVAADVCLFNKIVRHFGDQDTVAYTSGQSSLTYLYQGEALTTWSSQDDDAYGTTLILRRTKTGNIDQFLAIVPIKEKTVRVYERVINPDHGVHIYKKYEEVNGLAVGDYLALDEQQARLASGRYELKDTLLETREETFDPETYQEVIKVTTVDLLSVKTGVWRYATKPGQPMREENYDARSGWASPDGEDALCAPFNWEKVKERNYYKTGFNRIPSLVRLFNYISGTQGLPEYISYDVTRNGVTYYHNGQIVAGPQLRNEREAGEAIEQQLPEGVLKIAYTSNEFDAFQAKGTKTTYKFACYLPKVAGKGISYTLTNGRLEIADATSNGKEGAFTTTDCSGNTLIEGFYRAPRSGDKGVEVINPETYETMITMPNEFKCGNWKYYNKDGSVVKEVEVGKCD